MKTCYKCRRSLPLEAFHKSRTRVDGLQHHCASCSNDLRRAARRRDPAHTQRRDREERLHRKGLTQAQYDARFVAQGGLCALCHQPGQQRPGDLYPLVIDHDHRCCPGATSCGRCIRGLLCHDCNKSLGHWESTRGRHAAFEAFAASTLVTVA